VLPSAQLLCPGIVPAGPELCASAQLRSGSEMLPSAELLRSGFLPPSAQLCAGSEVLCRRAKLRLPRAQLLHGTALLPGAELRPEVLCSVAQLLPLTELCAGSEVLPSAQLLCSVAELLSVSEVRCCAELWMPLDGQLLQRGLPLGRPSAQLPARHAARPSPREGRLLPGSEVLLFESVRSRGVDL
jgi:hypothetical protein